MKKKISLKEVTVKSFVTSIEPDKSAAIKGGSGLPCDATEITRGLCTGMYPTLNMPCK